MEREFVVVAAYGIDHRNQDAYKELSPTVLAPMGGDSAAKVLVINVKSDSGHSRPYNPED